MPGSWRARAPVARMMCGAFSVATGLPSFSTASVCLPASLPVPSNTVILFLRIRCATPDESCFATARERFTTLSRSNFASTGGEAVVGQVVQQMVDLGGAQQRLGRDAAPVEADAAQVLAFHHGGLQAELRARGWRRHSRRGRRRGRSGRSSAQPLSAPSASAVSAAPSSCRTCQSCIGRAPMRVVEIDRGLVPVQHAPFDAPAVLGDGAAREGAQQAPGRCAGRARPVRRTGLPGRCRDGR